MGKSEIRISGNQEKRERRAGEGTRSLKNKRRQRRIFYLILLHIEV
jgi:hypothetical protein